MNAMSLVNNNAAILIKDSSARAELVKATITLLQNAEKQAVLSKNIYQLAKPEAAREIAEEVLKLVK